MEEGLPSGGGISGAVASQRRPRPRLREGAVLAETGAVRAMIDISDGLGLDLWRMCEAGGLGVRLEADRVPVDPGVRQVVERLAAAPSAHVSAGTRRPDPLDLALYGGEDYELLFALDPGEAGRVFGHLAEQTGTMATAIGTIEEASAGRVLVIGGRPMALDPGGWTHFKGDLR
jgi:thiamine-monophosphate kinase